MSIADWRAWCLPEVRTRWSARECAVYALGVGCGGGVADDLRFLRPGGVTALPTMAAVLGAQPMWPMLPEYGLDWRQILHGEHALVLHRPLEAAGDPRRLGAISIRFSAPAFPGDTIRTEAWVTDGGIRFRARALERDAVVLDCGRAAIG